MSHECLLRQWKRLVSEWIPEERESRRVFVKLVERAEDKQFLVDPVLQATLDWWASRRPNRPWACRYDPRFDLARTFLRESEAARQEQRRRPRSAAPRPGRSAARKRNLAFLGGLLLVACGIGGYRERPVRDRAHASRRDGVGRSHRARCPERAPSHTHVDVRRGGPRRQSVLRRRGFAPGGDPRCRANQAIWTSKAQDVLTRALATLPLRTTALHGLPERGQGGREPPRRRSTGGRGTRRGAVVQRNGDHALPSRRSRQGERSGRGGRR